MLRYILNDADLAVVTQCTATVKKADQEVAYQNFIISLANAQMELTLSKAMAELGLAKDTDYSLNIATGEFRCG